MRGVGDPVLPVVGGALKLLGGGLGGKLLKGAGKLLGIGGGVATGSAIVKAAKSLPVVAKMGAGGAAMGGGMAVVEQLMGPSSPAFPSGRRRRGRGITANELRGFNKVANLLRRVGMVPKATRRAVRRGR